MSIHKNKGLKMENKQKDWRFAQADKEALMALGAYALYFIWWYVFAYGMGSGDPENYNYIFGLPEWFFYSCIVGYPFITIVLWVLVRFKFKHMPLDDDLTDEETTSSETATKTATTDKGVE